MNKKFMCQTCANQVNGDWCTRQLEMHNKSMIYKKCVGYKEYIAQTKKNKIEIKKISIDYEEMGIFGKFLKKGGHYSFRTNEFIGIKEVEYDDFRLLKKIKKGSGKKW